MMIVKKKQIFFYPFIKYILISLLYLCTYVLADDCTSLTNCDNIIALPTGEECETLGTCSCAQQIQCYIDNNSTTDNWNKTSTGELHWNRFFWHTRFLETYISPIGEAAMTDALNPNIKLNSFPAGTILVKIGYSPEDESPDSIDISKLDYFITVKLEGGYCPEEYEINGSCHGGEWFWYHYIAESLQSLGKPEKCTGCHNVAEKGDFLMTVIINRRYPPP